MAGLWDRWTSPDGEIVETFAIITKPAEEGIGEIHDRMPAILRKEHFEAWLSPSSKDAATLLALLGDASPVLVATKVSSRVNKPDYDAPDCLSPEETQRGLFE
jgi:putative SOS response-associated peptidase YedK